MHHRYMQAALQLARRNLGQTWPNPSVGAVLVKGGQIIGEGFTARGGRPHAETQALQQAGSNAKGATLYVTLEPCSHHGKTPPCTDAIIVAGIGEVVIACTDPNPLVAGQGIRNLQQAGIKVIMDIGKDEAMEINRGFFSIIEKKRPFISLKIATSLNQKMIPGKDASRWITNEQSRAYVHLLRSKYDAIATGIGTVIADNPVLTCRLPGFEDRSPQPIVFDRNNQLPAGSHLAKRNAWTLNSPDILTAINSLKEKGVTRLFVEAGPKLSTAFLQSGLVDRMYWFTAPMTIEDGISVSEAMLVTELAKLTRWKQIETMTFGNDTLKIYESN